MRHFVAHKECHAKIGEEWYIIPDSETRIARRFWKDRDNGVLFKTNLFKMGAFWYACTFAIAGESVAKGYRVTTWLTSKETGSLVHNGPAFSIDSISTEDEEVGVFYGGINSLFRVDTYTFARYHCVILNNNKGRESVCLCQRANSVYKSHPCSHKLVGRVGLGGGMGHGLAAIGGQGGTGGQLGREVGWVRVGGDRWDWGAGWAGREYGSGLVVIGG